MNNLARELDHAVTQEFGTVLRVGGDEVFVRAGSGDHRARRAASCLVCPSEGDLVLLATNAQGHGFVLAVLERDQAEPTRLVVDGDMQLAPTGKLTLAAGGDMQLAPTGKLTLAAGGVELVAREALKVLAGSVELKAIAGNVVLERISLIGRYLESDFERVKSFAKSCDSVLERFSQRVKRSYRTIEESDHVRAGQIDYVARRTMNLHGENAVVTAAELVKVDGAQIHVG
ncbi:MAG: DUF3540 domain-containing protein [Myxococcales bacterium]|nr:DUF3540 domain-containing protein [Myxococcales bacterium]